MNFIMELSLSWWWLLYAALYITVVPFATLVGISLFPFRIFKNDWFICLFGFLWPITLPFAVIFILFIFIRDEIEEFFW